MRFHAWVILFATVLGTVHGAPVEEAVVDPVSAQVLPAEVVPEVPVIPVLEEQPKEIVSEVPEVVPVPEVVGESGEVPVQPVLVQVEDEVVEKADEKKGRQLEDEDDDEGEGDHDEDEDDDEDEDENEDEEEEQKLAAKGSVAPGKAQKKKGVVPGKPVPVLGEGVEDDEAEDLGIFEREEPKSDEVETEKSSDEKSDEEKDDDDESAEDEERDDPIGGPSGLVAEPGSIERGDVEEGAASSPIRNEVSGVEQPLAVAVVQPEESADPVVPIVVEESVPSPQSVTPKVDVSRKQKPKATQDDDDDDDDEDDDEDEDEDDEGRSEKIHRHRARAAYNPSPVLYYYPFPEAPEPPAQ